MCDGVGSRGEQDMDILSLCLKLKCVSYSIGANLHLCRLHAPRVVTYVSSLYNPAAVYGEQRQPISQEILQCACVRSRGLTTWRVGDVEVRRAKPMGASSQVRGELFAFMRHRDR